MVFSEVYLECIVVDKVLLLPCLIPPIANVTSLMLVSAMRVELIVTVKALSTETTFWMTLKPTLIDSPWIVIAELLMLAQFAKGKEIVLVGEDLFVPGAEITHDLVMYTLDMPM